MFTGWNHFLLAEITSSVTLRTSLFIDWDPVFTSVERFLTGQTHLFSSQNLILLVEITYSLVEVIFSVTEITFSLADITCSLAEIIFRRLRSPLHWLRLLFTGRDHIFDGWDHIFIGRYDPPTDRDHILSVSDPFLLAEITFYCIRSLFFTGLDRFITGRDPFFTDWNHFFTDQDHISFNWNHFLLGRSLFATVWIYLDCLIISFSMADITFIVTDSSMKHDYLFNGKRLYWFRSLFTGLDNSFSVQYHFSLIEITYSLVEVIFPVPEITFALAVITCSLVEIFYLHPLR